MCESVFRRFRYFVNAGFDFPRLAIRSLCLSGLGDREIPQLRLAPWAHKRLFNARDPIVATSLAAEAGDANASHAGTVLYRDRRPLCANV
jgi:hypothetical protein